MCFCVMQDASQPLGAPQVQEVDPEDMTSEDEDAVADQDALQAEGHTEGDEWSDGDLSDAELSGADDEGVVDSDEDLEEWDADELEDAARGGPDDAGSEENLREWDMGRGEESEGEEERAAAAEGAGQSEEDAAAGDSSVEEWDEDAAEEYDEDEEGAAASEEGDDDEYESDSDDERQRELHYWKELAGRQGHVPTEVRPQRICCTSLRLTPVVVPASSVAPACCDGQSGLRNRVNHWLCLLGRRCAAWL